MRPDGPVEFAVSRWGGGERTALLLHGLSSNAESWWRVGPDLAAEGWAVTAPDLRGHGHSGDGADFSLAGYRDDVLALGSAWDLVVGHSLGGAIALACQLEDPGFARGVVLEDPALRWSASPEVVAWLLDEYQGPITEESVAASRPRWAAEDVAGKVRALRQAGEHVVAGTVADLDGTDLWPRLREVDVPVLVIGADLAMDALVSAEDAARIADLPTTDYVPIPNASHSIHRDSYAAFMDILAGWVERNLRL